MAQTSLAQQLAKLAVPQTTLLNKDKKRASLLFDAKEAATLTHETVYLIGREGFDELVALDHDTFQPFAGSLFSEQSKGIERAVESGAFNSELNETLRKFLRLLSPYFLQRCTHKCLEWLIHRFHVHEYNIDELIFLALPYHETNIFVRVLQVIKLTNNDKWLWLRPLQRPGVHLPKSTLYTHAASNANFLKLIGDDLLQTLRVNRYSNVSTLLTFYCATFIGAIDYCAQITEAHLTSIIPAVMRSFKCPSNSDFSSAAYMIIAKLMTKTPLAKRLLNMFVDNVAQYKNTTLKIEATLLLVIIYQHQIDFREISDKAFVKIAGYEWFCGALVELATSGSRIQPLLKVLIDKGLDMVRGQNAEAAKKLINGLMVLKIRPLIPELIRSILLIHDSNSDSNDVQLFLTNLLDTIHVQYPNEFDDTINKLMQLSKIDSASTKKQRENFRILTRGKLNGGFEWCAIFEQLNHPVASIRRESVDVLIKNYDGYSERNRDFFKSMITNRFVDEDVDVINQCLVSDKDLVVRIMDRETLVDILNNILLKSLENQEKYCKLTIPALDMLLPITQSEDYETFVVLLSFFYQKNTDELKITDFIANYNNCAAKFFEDLKNINKHPDFIIKSLPGVTELINCLKRSTLNKYPTFKATSVKLLVDLLENNATFETSNLILDLIAHSTNSSKKPHYFQLENRRDFTLPKYLSYLEKIIENTTLDDNEEVSAINKRSVPKKGVAKTIILNDFSVDSATNKFVITLMDICTKGLFYKKKYVASFALTFNKFLDKYAEDLTGKVVLCLNIASAESAYVPFDLQVRCLMIAQTIVKKRQTDLAWNSKQEVVLAFLLVLLKKPRESWFKNIVFKLAQTLAKNHRTDFAGFLVEILKNKDEILLDADQLPWILLNATKAQQKFRSVLDCLTNQIFEGTNKMPLYIQANYLELTILSADIENFAKTSKLASEILEKRELDQLQSRIVHSNINRLNQLIASSLKLSSPIWLFMREILLNDKNVLRIAHKEHSQSPCVTAMSMIDREFYSHLKSTVQNSLIDTVITIASKSDNPDILSAAARMFKHIELDAPTITPVLISMRDVQSEKTTLKRNRRISVIPTVDLLSTEQWRKGVCALELIQDKKKLSKIADLIPILFDLLKKCLDFDEQSNVEYPKQLILSSILHCCVKSTDAAGVPAFAEGVFNMSLIVQCMRSSWNPQTHHHTLVLLAHCATFSPNQVLQNIMAIFTFMGSSYLRHDDAYSFQIIAKIVDTIIPILIRNDTIDNILSILGVFADAITDVPEHRRATLYHQFLRKLNSELYTNYFVLLMFRNHVRHANAEKLRAAKNPVSSAHLPKRLDIAANLLEEFDAGTILTTLDHMLQYLRELPVEKEDSATANDLILATMNNCTTKEFRHYKYTIVQFVANLLSSRNFVNKIAGLTADDLMALEPVYKNIIIHALTYIQVTNKVAQKNTHSPQTHYWTVLVHHSYDILDSINALLTPQMFLLVIKGLLTHSLPTVRRRALELLNVKLQHNQDFFHVCQEHGGFNDIIVSLVNIIKTIAAAAEEQTHEHDVIVQTALLSLKLITRLQAGRQPEKFAQLLSIITELIKCEHLNGNILASLILCLAELCSQLKMHSISHLNSFMPVVVRVLKSQRSVAAPNLLLLSCVTAIQKMVDCLSLFLTPYLAKIICELTYQTTQWNDSKTPITNKIDAVWEKIAASIQPRVLIPIIDASYNSLITKKRLANIGPLMKLLSKNIEQHRTVVLESHVLDLTSFFLNALQFRGFNETIAESALVEEHITKVFIVLILKLSERSFRPLFYKLYDWALRCDDKSDRAITFYNLTREISANLKGLFVLFAGHFLHNASAILDQCNVTKKTSNQCYFPDTERNVLLLENVLATLNGVFAHDTQKFVNKERFDVLMQPLVDQLENQIGGVDSLKKRAKQILIPSIVNFAVATGDDSLWKQLNYQICLKMRNTDAAIRIISVECLTEIVKKVGDDFLPLLPETIPFLGELLEDEIEEVEKVCYKSIQEMEGILGEPLQKYF